MKAVPNPAYTSWLLDDQKAIMVLNASLTADVLGETIGLLTARAIWLALESAYNNTSVERIQTLRDQLRQISKGSASVGDFGRRFKYVCDQLAAAGQPVDETEKSHLFLRGLGTSFGMFSTTTRVVKPTPPLRDIRTQAESYELLHSSTHDSGSPPVTFNSTRGRGSRGGISIKIWSKLKEIRLLNPGFWSFLNEEPLFLKALHPFSSNYLPIPPNYLPSKSSMSSSTLSITPNPTLRRPTTTKSVIETDQIHPPPATHTTKPALETAPNNTLQTKTSVHTTKSRKRPKPSPWKTAVSVIVKNLGLVVILLLLIKIVRRLAFNQLHGGVNPVISDLGQRITEVEAVMKTTTKMVARVDLKIASEMTRLSSELGEKIDGLGKKFSDFDSRADAMESVSTGWLSKAEFETFVKGFNFNGFKGGLELDEIRAFAREVVEREIGRHAADGVGRVDYALASGGGVVVKHSEAFSGGRRVSGWFSGNVRSDAVKMLQPSFGQPGECFPLKGDSGFVEIKLRTGIVVEAVTLEHVSKSVAFDLSTAPKHCKVWGWSRNEEDTQIEHLLAEFTYDLEKSSAQTFNVLESEGLNPTIIDTIRLQFMSNHGSPTHTCIYRVRVHGHQPDVA